MMNDPPFDPDALAEFHAAKDQAQLEAMILSELEQSLQHWPWRPVLVGEQPSKWADPTRALIGGQSGARLEALSVGDGNIALPRIMEAMETIIGVRRMLYLRAFVRCNLVPLAGYVWPRRRTARKLAEALESRFADHAFGRDCKPRAVVLLGKRVAEAFEVPYRIRGRFMSVSEARRAVVYFTIPHPSGRCRLWNDPEVLGLARQTLHALAQRSLERTAEVAGPVAARWSEKGAPGRVGSAEGAGKDEPRGGVGKSRSEPNES